MSTFFFLYFKEVAEQEQGQVDQGSSLKRFGGNLFFF
jgi:hypothetical protein